MKDFILFRYMLTPWLIQIFFWLAVVVCIVSGFVNFFHKQWLAGVEILIFGPLIARVVCEFFIIFFKINENLVAIKNTRKK